MSTTMTPETGEAPGPGARRTEARRRAGLIALVAVIVLTFCGGLVLFGWMVDETHFARPSDEFDTFAAEVDELPGVTAVEHERWVEAPDFWSPTSWISVTVDEEGLPGVLDAACAGSYAEPVSWGITVMTLSAAEVTLPTAPVAADTSACPDLGFDAVPLIAELDRVAPGIDVQASIWTPGRFGLVTLEYEASRSYLHLLPLVEHSNELLDAAGLEADDAMVVNAPHLGALIHPDESDAYFQMLTELAAHGVTSYWGDSGDIASDEIELVQVVAPESQHAAIEEVIRTSGLRLAGAPVRFLEP